MKGLLTAAAVVLLAASVSPAKIGGGDITFTVNGAGAVVFSHELHVQKKGLKCADCHNAIFIPKTSAAHSSMDRMQKGESCGACHNGKRAFPILNNCAKCHS